MSVPPSIQASENPVKVPSWDQAAAVTLHWTCDETVEVEVRVDAPDGPLLSRTGGPGTAATGPWLRGETTFYLQDVTGGKPPTPEHTLATVTVSVVAERAATGSVILMYHRIAADPWDPFKLCVSPGHFAEHLEVLSSRGLALPLGKLAGAVNAGEVPSGFAAVTFDDGYADNLQTAKPLLETYAIPATVFITSGYVGDPRGYWWDELADLARNRERVDSDLYFMLDRWLRQLDHEERRGCLDRLRRWLRAAPALPSSRRPMSAEELRRLAATPLIEIGSHTRTHPRLGTLPVPEQLAEIRESKLALEAVLNRPVAHFAYPHGSAGPETAGLVKSAGFESACLASAGLVSSKTDPYRLPRMQVHNWDGDGFSRRLSQWLAASWEARPSLEKPSNGQRARSTTHGSVSLSGRPPGPLVSVIVSTYDRPALLERALRSVLSQTYREFEIVLVNDGGPDLKAVLDKIQCGQALRCLVHPSNKGLAAARNTGMREARGKYIAYLDDDDVYYPEHLETLISFLESGEYKVAYTDARRAWQEVRDGELVTTKTDSPYSWEFDRDQLLDSNHIPILCIAHRRSCLDEVGMMDESLPVLEDLDLWIRMSRVYDFAHIPKVTCEFSWRPQSGTLSTRHGEFATALDAIYKKYESHRQEREVRLLRGELQSARDQIRALRDMLQNANDQNAALGSELERLLGIRYWLKSKWNLTFRKAGPSIGPRAGPVPK